MWFKCQNSSISNNSVDYMSPIRYKNCSIPNNSVLHNYTILFSFTHRYDLSSISVLGQSEPQFYGTGGAHGIPKSSSITEASPSDCLASNSGDSLGVIFCSSSRLGKIDREREMVCYISHKKSPFPS